MKKTFYTIIFLSFCLIGVFICSNFTLAVELEGLHGGDQALTTLSNETGVQIIIGTFARIILGFMGAAALLMFVIGGYYWIIAAGSTEKIDLGKKMMVWAGIGLIVILFSRVITDFIIYSLTLGSAPPAPPATYACNDGIDNDGDGLIDFGKDPGCASADDDDEWDAPAQCARTFDCAGFGYKCYDCLNAFSTGQYYDNSSSICTKNLALKLEAETKHQWICNLCVGFYGCSNNQACCCSRCQKDCNPSIGTWAMPIQSQCSDGCDNDGDGKCDTVGSICVDGSIPGDPDCTDPTRNSEAP